MKVVQNIVPAVEPTTIAVKETINREEVRISIVRKDGKKKVDLRIWDIAEDGNATPHNGGFLFSPAEAAALRDALNGMEL